MADSKKASVSALSTNCESFRICSVSQRAEQGSHPRNRWQKYAYGCNELLFRPLSQWWRGPISPLIIRYIRSNIPLHSKISVFSYIFSYYAIASSVVLSIMNWAIEGLFNGYLDHFYQDSWRIWITVVVVFVGLGNFSSAVSSDESRERE